ncbi:MAG: hypothetical protein J5770_01215 [Bacteroidaceae bacterium]|nr:hypothetical protein [Bacteroidaceae bacterium]
MKKITFLMLALFATMCQSAFAQSYPQANDKGYLYNIQAKKFINADAEMGDEGVLFTIVFEANYEGGWNKNGNVFNDPAGRSFYAVRFTTDFTDAERDNKVTMLSCRANDVITATKVNGYGVFPLYDVTDKGLLIFCFYNKDNADFYSPGKCLSYDADGKLVFVDEEQATYWKFMSEAEYKELKGENGGEGEGEGGNETDPYTGEGYTDLTADMFKLWDDAINPTTGEATACSFVIGEESDAPYGNTSVLCDQYADLSSYEKLIVVVSSDSPRFFMNMEASKEDGGAYNSDESLSKRLEMPKAGQWPEKYYTIDGNIYTIDLKAIVTDKGFAHLHAIKASAWNTKTVVTKMVLYKDPTATSIAEVHEKTTTSAIYNLSGQRLNQLQKGINIVGGKRIWVK